MYDAGYLRLRPAVGPRDGGVSRGRAPLFRDPAAGLTAGLAAIALISVSLPSPAGATDLLYGLQSPAFGGTNPAALQAAEYDKSLAAQRAASIAAAAAAATAANPNQQFANAIVSQLNSLVARNVALAIAGSSNGQSGTIQSGSDSVTYVNSDGQLNIVINTPTGSTTVNLPSGN